VARRPQQQEQHLGNQWAPEAAGATLLGGMFHSKARLLNHL
jgi:hypothetical protein